MPASQSSKHHAMVDPLLHYVIMPLLTVNFLFAWAIWVHQHREYPYLAAWWIILSFTFMLLAYKTRVYALRNQDRLIRLEERLRLAALLPTSERTALESFTTGQLIALRFASDGELPTLAQHVLTEHMTPKQIKEAVVTWRPDDSRV